MTKVLNHSEYQERVKSIKTPEEAMAFMQEFITPFLPKAKAAGEENQDATHTPKYHHSPLIKALKKSGTLAPWYDVVNNETEAMVIALYAKGMTTRDVVTYLKNTHGIELSQPSVSAITDKVFPLVKEWQARPLSSCYPVVYLDGLHFKVRESGKIASKVAYIALGVNQYGEKEVLGIWISQSEGAKFWVQVLNDIKNRGVEDILIACVDGLKGFPDAIKSIYPHTDVQVCIVHQIRHTIKFVSYKDRDKFCDDLKTVYGAVSEEAGMQALKETETCWPQYQAYLKSWDTRWSDLAPFFGYPEPIRRMIYTTNTIENLNRQFRKVTKTTGVFPHDDALLKLLWLAQADMATSWRFTIRNWGQIMAQLTILFPDRVEF